MNEQYLTLYLCALALTAFCYWFFLGIACQELVLIIPLVSLISGLLSGSQWMILLGLVVLFLLHTRFFSKHGKSERLRLISEILIYYLTYRSGFSIPFVHLIGDFIYLDLLSPVFTVIWLLLLTRTFCFIGRLNGVVPGIMLMFSAILFMVSRSQQSPLLFAEHLAVMVAAFATFYSIMFVVRKVGLTQEQTALLGYLAGIMSITGVTKRVAFVALIFPSFFIILPFYFIASFIFYFYLRENLTEVRKSAGYQIIWRFTNRRALISTYFIFFYLAVWFFTLLAKISIPMKIATISLATTAMTLLVFILTVKMENYQMREKKLRNLILGIPIDNLDRGELLEAIDRRREQGEKVFVTTPNAVAFVIAHGNGEFRKALSNASFNIPDGAGVIWAADVLENSLQERITGVDFMMLLLKKAADEGR
ncbi:MAG: hypothetical protein PHQ23_13615, partial [Candidatus Wallbacteria bacterium]|nr:hypothetical protein [Candidatus Wallbacteria bacterium]